MRLWPEYRQKTLVIGPSHIIWAWLSDNKFIMDSNLSYLTYVEPTAVIRDKQHYVCSESALCVWGRLFCVGLKYDRLGLPQFRPTPVNL